MISNWQPKYEEHFIGFIDLLGFSEASTVTDEATRMKVLRLLRSISSLRGEFDVTSTPHQSGKTTTIKPAISTFSDDIVVSWPVRPACDEMGPDESVAAIVIFSDFTSLLERIAAAALRIGFLIRGGASIGKLYHAGGVVFGEALIDAYEIESRTSIYPRVVLSAQIMSRPKWSAIMNDMAKCEDGLYHFDYFKRLLYGTTVPGKEWAQSVKTWLEDVFPIVAKNVTELRACGRLNEYAKWSWFAREFRVSLESQNPELLSSLGISLGKLKSPE
jgi:hypothetical protein